MELLVIILTIIGAVAAVIFGYLQVVVPFTKGEVKFSKRFPFVISVHGAHGTGGFPGERRRATSARAPGDHRKMLVILPFENLGSAEDEYFSDGIAEEITARLATVNRLGVIARTSAMHYKNSNKTIQQIGDELGVEYVLEGTVRWQKSSEGPSRVRVTPQLIKVSDSTHLWANVYDKVLAEVFEVQSDIAEHVTSALDIALLEPERQALEAQPTENLEAYDYYLRGNDYFKRGYEEENLRTTEEMYQKAVALDPNFALAYAMLSWTHAELYWFYIDRTEARTVKAKEAVDKALAIDPNLPAAHLALGLYYYWAKLDYDRALVEFAIAQESQPNNSDLFLATAAVQRRQGKWEEAVVNYRKAAELDPRSPLKLYELALTHHAMAKFPEEERYIERALSLAPELFWPHVLKFWLYLHWRGDTKKAREVLEQAAKKVKPDNLVEQWAWIDVLEGKYQSALDRLTSTKLEYFETQIHYAPKTLLLAQIYELLGQPQRKQDHYESACTLLEKHAEERPEDARFHGALGVAYAGLGRKEEAVREGERAVELYPISKDALIGPYMILNLARVYTMVGQYDAAIDKLEYLLTTPSGLAVPLVQIDPTWAPLEDHPGFQKLVENQWQPSIREA